MRQMRRLSAVAFEVRLPQQSYCACRRMKIEESKHSIAELIDLIRRKDLVVNEEYQRAPRLWPPAPRSYFIDTILSGYPFPKVYFHETLNRSTLRPLREIVDGQQRMMCILDYFENKFALGKNSVNFNGKRFRDLSEEAQEGFLTYTVAVDVIRNSQRSEILQMFRRMNAYTLPLNDAEKRHSEFFGDFKDWVNRTLDRWAALFSDWHILTSRQIVRMEDAEFIAEVALAYEHGLISSSNKLLRDIYLKYDDEFPYGDEWLDKTSEVLSVISTELSGLQGSYMTKSYAFLSLITALVHNKWGIPGMEAATGCPTTGRFFDDSEIALGRLLDLAAAHETKDISKYPEYVEACKGGSNRVKQRTVRAQFICRALQHRPH